MKFPYCTEFRYLSAPILSFSTATIIINFVFRQLLAILLIIMILLKNILFAVLQFEFNDILRIRFVCKMLPIENKFILLTKKKQNVINYNVWVVWIALNTIWNHSEYWFYFVALFLDARTAFVENEWVHVCVPHQDIDT